MEIKNIPIEEINVIGDNPRELSDERFEALKKYAKKYGLLTPLVVDKRSNSLIGGHSRLLAIKELGWKEVPCNMVEPKDDSERKEMQLIDNEQFGHWIEDELVVFVKDTGIILEDYEIQTDSISLDEIVNGEDVDIDDFFREKTDEEKEKEREEEQEKKEIKCPKCGFLFER